MDQDIIKEICSYLSNKNILHFLSITKQHHQIKKFITFNISKNNIARAASYNKIYKLFYYDSFISMKLSKLKIKPNSTLYLPKNISHLFFDSTAIPENITFIPNKIHTITIGTKYSIINRAKSIDFSYVKHLTINRLLDCHLPIIELCSNLESIQILSSRLAISDNLFLHMTKLCTIDICEKIDNIYY